MTEGHQGYVANGSDKMTLRRNSWLINSVYRPLTILDNLSEQKRPGPQHTGRICRDWDVNCFDLFIAHVCLYDGTVLLHSVNLCEYYVCTKYMHLNLMWVSQWGLGKTKGVELDKKKPVLGRKWRRNLVNEV